MSAAEDRLNDPFQTAPAATVVLPTVITGQVDSAGAIVAGTGFTVNRSATGVYDVTFTTAFSAAPTVLASTANSAFTSRFLNVSAVAAGTCTVRINDNANAGINTAFDFLAYETA